MSLGDGDAQPSIERRLRGCERARLQGLPPAICKLATEGGATKRILGNAMAVPVIGSVLAMELNLLLRHSTPSAIAAWLSSFSAKPCGSGEMHEASVLPGQGTMASSSGHLARDSSPGWPTSKRQRMDKAKPSNVKLIRIVACL